jgi:hypothetical protein
MEDATEKLNHQRVFILAKKGASKSGETLPLKGCAMIFSGHDSPRKRNPAEPLFRTGIFSRN